MVVVAAAGNLGYTRLIGEHDDTLEQYTAVSITDPGNADRVITVGSPPH
jgi:serine protease AprX